MKSEVFPVIVLAMLLNVCVVSVVFNPVSAWCVHDIAVMNVKPSPSIAVPGDLVSITVEIENQGDYNETFEVTVFYDHDVVAPVQNVNDLMPRANTTLTFIWNTTDVAFGDYIVKAKASIVAGEDDVRDNTFIGGRVTVSKVAIDVELDVGSVYFRGELTEIGILASVRGETIDATINATLFHNGTLYVDLSAYIEHVANGLYRVPYTMPTEAPTGTYMLVVEASYLTLKGTALKSFLLSPTFTVWNAVLININETVGTIGTAVDLIEVKLDTINATLVNIDGGVATINSTLGAIQADVDTINATLVNIAEGVATVNSTVGVIRTGVDTINAQLTAVNNTVGTIQTDVGAITADLADLQFDVTVINGTITTIQTTVGAIEGRITSIEENIVTIETDIGIIKTMLEGLTVQTTGPITTSTGNFKIVVLTTSNLEEPIQFSDNILTLRPSGSSGTTGITNIVIPKQLLFSIESSIDRVAITIDDEPAVFTYTEKPEEYALQIICTHSTHVMKVYLTGLPPTLFPVWVVAATVFIVTVAICLAFIIPRIRKPRIASSPKGTANPSC